MIAFIGFMSLALGMIGLADGRFVVPMVLALAALLGSAFVVMSVVSAWKAHSPDKLRAKESLGAIIAKPDNLLILVGGLLLLLVAIILEGAHGSTSHGGVLFELATWKHLSQELAFALLIAFVIIISIERRSRDEMKREYETRLQGLQLNAISAVFGINADRKLVDRVFDVLGDPFYRWNQHTSLEFVEAQVNSKDGLPVKVLVMSVSLNYQIENRGATPVSYPVKLAVERSTIKGVPYSEEHMRKHSSVGEVYVGPERINLKEDAHEGVTFYEGSTILAVGEKLPVSLSFSTIRRHDDAEYFWVKHPCDGMTVEMKLPSDDYLIEAYAPARELVCTMNTGARRVWRLDGPILPNEGIYISWQRANAQCRAAVAPAAVGTGAIAEAAPEPDLILEKQ